MEHSPLTSEENRAVECSIALWNALVALPVEHPDDIHEMRQMIHALQDKILARPTRRVLATGNR